MLNIHKTAVTIWADSTEDADTIIGSRLGCEEEIDGVPNYAIQFTTPSNTGCVIVFQLEDAIARGLTEDQAKNLDWKAFQNVATEYANEILDNFTQNILDDLQMEEQ